MAKTFYSDYFPNTAGVEGSTVPTPAHSITEPSPVTIYADYTGTTTAGQLPLDIQIIRMFGDIDVSSLTSWSLDSTGVTATIDSSGIINITVVSNTGTITVTSTYKDVTLITIISVTKIQGIPPTSGGGGGGGGTSASTSAISQSTSSSYGAANTGILSVVAGSAGQVSCTFPATYQRTTNGSGLAHGKWQWRVVGGSFADITTEISSSDGSFRSGPPEPEITEGYLYCNMTKTSLTNGTTYEFQLLLRGSGAYTLNYFGTATATGS